MRRMFGRVVGRAMGRIVIVSVVALLVVGVLPPGGLGALPANAQSQSPRRNTDVGPGPQHDEQLAGAAFVEQAARRGKSPTMASSLVGVGQQARDAGRAAGLRVAQDAGVAVSGERVRVSIAASGPDVGPIQAAVQQAGGTIERTSGGLVQALVPPSGLEQVSKASGVQYVQPTQRLIPNAVSGQEVNVSGAGVWQGVGAAGSGTKIAVLDGDFKGYQARQESGDLPANLTTKNFCADGFESGLDDSHGTAVAEIVYEMAPGAQLYLVCAATLTEMVDGVQYMIDNGVKIINHSRGLFNTSRADGALPTASTPSYLPESLITKAYNAGVLWVNSSGNSAQKHWTGTFADTDADGVHNFSGTDEGNNVTLAAGATIAVYLKWDEWPSSTQDFDLYLSRVSSGVVVSSSTNDQTVGGVAPTETLLYRNQGSSSEELFISIVRFRGTGAPRFDLFADGSTSALQYKNPDGSVTDFAVSPRALTVGAACWQTPTTIETYSSQGPTIAPGTTGVKPDITGLDSMSSGTYGAFVTCGGFDGFAGTSAASPTVAGAAALARDANPSLTTPDALKTYLKGKVTDAGATGADTVYGSGVLALGTLSVPSVSCPSTTGRFSINSSIAGGALTTTIQASGTDNRLLKVIFGEGSHLPLNAAITLADGRAVVTSLADAYYTPFGTTQTTFSTKRRGSGATTVPFIATDRCGDWKSFVGAGTSVTGF